ncbi:MAG: hypothetical protein IT298_03320 [Chloroflexi bacterium]|nr:hypothetical protein [Anaerolineae bacterium]MCC6564767.1 hypothetical protein [Chloroflexota bacterium]
MTEAKPKPKLTRVLQTVVIGYAAFILILIILGVLIARADPERAASIIAYIRDLLLVVIFATTTVVLFGTAILVVQIAALAGVLKIQTTAIAGELRGAVSAVRGAAVFIAETVASPVIRVMGFIGGLFAFLREITGLRRALRRKSPKHEVESDE